ncbi:hypothetical protein [Pseudotenacibaculum haliotis]|uniref:Uncharacterized protein n=1 Tax=Pseudotenacibaculum haliotis TaxID=1862138 RepID=A0ABW5LR46_9FLAO
MLDKILLISKKEEAGIIIISRMIGAFSIVTLGGLLLHFWIMKSYFFVMIGVIITSLCYLINSIFLLGVFVKLFQKNSNRGQCFLSILYLLIGLIVAVAYDQVVVNSQLSFEGL